MKLRWLRASPVSHEAKALGFGLLLVGSLILGAVAGAAQPTATAPHHAPAQQPAAKPASIDHNGVLILIGSKLLALDHTNKTGSYTVLRDLGAPRFQINTAAKLAEIYAKPRNDKIDLSGAAVIDPQLPLLPQTEPTGMLHMVRFFSVGALSGEFRAACAPVDGQWRVFGVSVGQSAPVAPPTSEAPPANAMVSQKQAPPPAVPAK